MYPSNASRFESRLIPTIRKRSLAYFFQIFLTSGISYLQGPHQVAQKSNRTTLPRNFASESSSPRVEDTLKAGATRSPASFGFAITARTSSASFAFGASSIYFFNDATPSSSLPSLINEQPRL